jgi:hypothetical protein
MGKVNCSPEYWKDTLPLAQLPKPGILMIIRLQFVVGKMIQRRVRSTTYGFELQTFSGLRYPSSL